MTLFNISLTITIFIKPDKKRDDAWFGAISFFLAYEELVRERQATAWETTAAKALGSRAASSASILRLMAMLFSFIAWISRL